MKLESLLLGRGLSFLLLLQRVGWEVGIFFSILLALLNLENEPTLGNMMLSYSDGTSSPKLPLPESSPVPSISSGGSSKFSEWFGLQTGASSSASAAEAEKEVIPSPEISKGELLGDSPNPQAPTSTSTGVGTHFPSAEEIRRELGDFLSSFSKCDPIFL